MQALGTFLFHGFDNTVDLITFSWFEDGGLILVLSFMVFCCCYLPVPLTVILLSFGIFHSLTCSSNGSVSCSKSAELAVPGKRVVIGTFLQFLIRPCPLLTLQEPSPRIKHFLLELSLLCAKRL